MANGYIEAHSVTWLTEHSLEPSPNRAPDRGTQIKEGWNPFQQGLEKVGVFHIGECRMIDPHWIQAREVYVNCFPIALGMELRIVHRLSKYLVPEPHAQSQAVS